MKNLRVYGQGPYRVAVIHGGPGDQGGMAPVARELSKAYGVLEPIQTRTSLEGQIEELAETLQQHGDQPVTLIGHSWGAWLALLVAARHPEVAGKLILVGSGPFEAHYVPQLSSTRFSRLSPSEQVEFRELLDQLQAGGTAEKDRLMARLGALVSKTDEFDPALEHNPETEFKPDGEVFQAVWNEAAELRRSGRLLQYAVALTCPVVAIHGEYDPHPAEGVLKPLSAILDSFRFVLLERCGHSPWKERHARERFYAILQEELAGG